MATRSSSSEFQPAPPNMRLAGKQNGRFGAVVSLKESTSSEGIKPNMCCPPTTNGERAFGLVTPSQPTSAKAMKVVRGRLSQ